MNNCLTSQLTKNCVAMLFLTSYGAYRLKGAIYASVDTRKKQYTWKCKPIRMQPRQMKKNVQTN